MASRYNPTYRFLIDWSGNGRFDHPQADVSNVLLRGKLRYGSEPVTNEFRVLVAVASGKVTLDNADHRFDPDSPSLLVPVSSLFAKRQARLMIDDVVVWDGLARPDTRTNKSGSQNLNWDLESHQKTSLLARDAELTVTEDGTVAGLAQAFTAASGIPFGVASQQPTGAVFHTGSWLGFLDDFARYAGGWVIETHQGGFVFRSAATAANLPAATALGLSYEPLDDFRYSARTGHIRNYAQCRSYFWEPVVDFEGNPQETLLTSNTVLTQGGTRTVELAFKNVANKRPLTWDRFDVPDGVELVSSSVAEDNLSAIAVVRAPVTEELERVRVVAYGKTEERREATERVLSIDDNDSQAIYGRRPLELPVWFRTDYAGVASYVNPWLIDLSEPPDHITARYRGLQATAARSEALARVRAGDAVIFAQVVDGVELNMDTLVLAVEVEWGSDLRPVHTFHGVRRRTFQAPPLGLVVDVFAIRDRTAQARVTVPFPNNEPIYIRYGQLGNNRLVWKANSPLSLGAGNPFVLGGVLGDWINIPSQNAATEDLVFQLSPLAPELTYIVQASKNADFSDPVTDIFTTIPQLSDPLLLRAVTINGNVVTGWNYETVLAFTSTVSFDTPSFAHRVEVAADPNEPTSIVTVDDAIQTGANGDVLMFRVTVRAQGVQPRTYTLTVAVAAPLSYEFNNVSNEPSVTRPSVDAVRASGGRVPYTMLDATQIAVSDETMFIAKSERLEYYVDTVTQPGRPAVPATADTTRTQSVSQTFDSQSAANTYIGNLRSTVNGLNQGRFTSGPSTSTSSTNFRVTAAYTWVTPGRPAVPATADTTSTQSVSRTFDSSSEANTYVSQLRGTVAGLDGGTFTSGPTVNARTIPGRPAPDPPANRVSRVVATFTGRGVGVTEQNAARAALAQAGASARARRDQLTASSGVSGVTVFTAQDFFTPTCFLDAGTWRCTVSATVTRTDFIQPTPARTVYDVAASYRWVTQRGTPAQPATPDRTNTGSANQRATSQTDANAQAAALTRFVNGLNQGRFTSGPTVSGAAATYTVSAAYSWVIPGSPGSPAVPGGRTTLVTSRRRGTDIIAAYDVLTKLRKPEADLELPNNAGTIVGMYATTTTLWALTQGTLHSWTLSNGTRRSITLNAATRNYRGLAEDPANTDFVYSLDGTNVVRWDRSTQTQRTTTPLRQSGVDIDTVTTAEAVVIYDGDSVLRAPLPAVTPTRAGPQLASINEHAVAVTTGPERRAIWVMDEDDNRIYAYNPVDGQRLP